VSSATSFTPATNSILTAIDFAAYLFSGPNQLTVYLTSGALPGAPIESFSVSVPAYPGSVISLTSVLQPELFAGTTYWVVLRPTTRSTLSSGGMLTRLAPPPALFRASWFQETAFAAPVFDVQGTAIPEPAAPFLVGASLLLLGMRYGARRLP
jgi:hypothetical protein